MPDDERPEDVEATRPAGEPADDPTGSAPAAGDAARSDGGGADGGPDEEESHYTDIPEWVSELRRLYVEPKSRAEMREAGVLPGRPPATSSSAAEPPAAEVQPPATPVPSDKTQSTDSTEKPGTPEKTGRRSGGRRGGWLRRRSADRRDDPVEEASPLERPDLGARGFFAPGTILHDSDQADDLLGGRSSLPSEEPDVSPEASTEAWPGTDRVADPPVEASWEDSPAADLPARTGSSTWDQEVPVDGPAPTVPDSGLDRPVPGPPGEGPADEADEALGDDRPSDDVGVGEPFGPADGEPANAEPGSDVDVPHPVDVAEHDARVDEPAPSEDGAADGPGPGAVVEEPAPAEAFSVPTVEPTVDETAEGEAALVAEEPTPTDEPAPVDDNAQRDEARPGDVPTEAAVPVADETVAVDELAHGQPVPAVEDSSTPADEPVVVHDTAEPEMAPAVEVESTLTEEPTPFDDVPVDQPTPTDEHADARADVVDRDDLSAGGPGSADDGAAAGRDHERHDEGLPGDALPTEASASAGFDPWPYAPSVDEARSPAAEPTPDDEPTVVPATQVEDEPTVAYAARDDDRSGSVPAAPAAPAHDEPSTPVAGATPAPVDVVPPAGAAPAAVSAYPSAVPEGRDSEPAHPGTPQPDYVPEPEPEPESVSEEPSRAAADADDSEDEPTEPAQPGSPDAEEEARRRRENRGLDDSAIVPKGDWSIVDTVQLPMDSVYWGRDANDPPLVMRRRRPAAPAAEDAEPVEASRAEARAAAHAEEAKATRRRLALVLVVVLVLVVAVGGWLLRDRVADVFASPAAAATAVDTDPAAPPTTL